MSSAAPSTQVKLCSKCGRDITHERRLKDAHGHYWCSDCGVPPELGATASGLISPCPKCHAPTHATQMMRKNGVYVCLACASGQKRKKGSGVHPAVHADEHGSAAAVVHHEMSDEDRAKRNKVILAVCLIIAGAVVYYLMNNVFI